MNVLVFNCGSSSLKYKLLSMPDGKMLAGGEAQRVGPKTAEPARILHRLNGVEEVHYFEMPDHGAAFERVMELLRRDASLAPDALGHRVVHGGSWFGGHAVVDEKALADLEKTLPLAPLHNPPAVNLLKASKALYPDLPQVAVFDTAYHATIPEYARRYALSRQLTDEMGVRKYGFHGTSHQFVVGEAAKFLGLPVEKLNAVSCHLGSGGASLCAVVGGKSVDNTMGYSPLQGLIMSTRSGDLDPAVTLNMLARAPGGAAAVEKTLNKNSGVLGMSGMSADIRDVVARVNGASPDPRLYMTQQTYLWRIRKYLGSYLAVVGHAHAIIFTDTIGETVPEVRWAVCSDMGVFGVKIDPERNRNVKTYPSDVAADDSEVRILVILTNEELAIAKFTYELLSAKAPATR